MATSTQGPAPAVPLFCGVCAEGGVFTRLGEETAERVEAADGVVIVACQQHVEPVARAISRVYGWAFVEAPESVNLILNPPPAQAAGDDVDEDDEDGAAADQEPVDELGERYEERAVRARVKAAPPAPAAQADDGDGWDELLSDIGSPQPPPAAAVTTSRVAAKAKTSAKGERAKAINKEDEPDLSSEETRAARAWARSIGLLTSEGREVPIGARLHRSIKAAWVDAGRPIV